MIIAIEGMDASGKATQAKLLAAKLEGVVLSFPDYTTPAGQLILGLLKEDWRGINNREDPPIIAHKKLNAMLLQSLMTINRLEVLPRIQELRTRNTPIVFDRYYASALVYGKIDDLDDAWTALIQAPMPEPDLWFMLDIPAEESARRRPERRDRYEKEPGLMERVRAGYLDLFKLKELSAEGRYRRWSVIDGLGSVEEVHARIWSRVLNPLQ